MQSSDSTHLHPRSWELSNRSGRFYPAFLLLLVYLLVASAAVATEEVGEVRELVPNRPVERALAASEIHVYSLAAEPGEHWRLTVQQLGIDVGIEVFEPGGRVLGTLDGPLGRWGRETCILSAKIGGHYRIGIRAKPPRVAPGRYEVVLELPGAVSFDQRRRLAAELADTSGGWLSGGQRAADLQQAMEFYHRARYYWQEIGDDFEVARAIQAVAELSRRVGELETAIKLFHRALEAWRTQGRRGREADALNGLGLAHLRSRAFGEARRFLTEALALNRGIGRAVEAAGNLMDLALIDQYQGALRRASGGYREAYRLYREAGHLEHEATLLNNLGGIYSRLGQPRQAEKSSLTALGLYRGAGDKHGEAAVLNNLAVLYRYQWQPDRALELYALVLAITRDLGDHRRESIAYNNMGYAYLELGELEKAREFFERALEMRREHGYKRSTAATLRNLGDLYDQQGDLRPAVESYRRSLALMREVGDRQGVMEILSKIGRDLVLLGEPIAARAHLDEASKFLASADDPVAKAEVLSRQGEAFSLLGEASAAAAALEESLELRRAQGDRLSELETLMALAGMERRRDRLPQAYDRLTAARAVVESLRAEILPTDLRATFFGSRRDVYELSIDVLMAMHARRPQAGHDLQALAISERAHARGLLDLLGEAEAELERGAEPHLKQRRRDLVARLAMLSGHLGRISSGSGQIRGVEAQDIVAELTDVRAELNLVDAEIRRGNPRRGSVIEPEPLTVDAMRGLLSEEDLLLHYALGEDRSFLWVLSSEVCESFVLPGRREVEAAARRTHRELRIPASHESSLATSESSALSEMILGPAAELLDGGRIIVVADGALHYMPFAALPVPAAVRRPAERWLVVRHEIVHLPSLSILAALARRAPGPATVAVVADPVFDLHDPRVVVPVESASASQPRAVTEFLERLPASREEARAIASLLPEADVLLALDFDASRAKLWEISRYRIVHFATHGEIDSRNPLLSKLVLSRVSHLGSR